MHTLILENIPSDYYDRLQRRAAERKRSPQDEAKHILFAGLQPGDKLPPPEYIPSQEISPPYDLPLPGVGIPIQPVPGPRPLPCLSDLPPEETA